MSDIEESPSARFKNSKTHATPNILNESDNSEKLSSISKGSHSTFERMINQSNNTSIGVNKKLRRRASVRRQSNALDNQMHEIGDIITYFSNFYASSIPKDIKKRPKWIVGESDRFKIFWDIFVTFLLLFTTLVVPVRLAFSEKDPVEWVIIYALVDLSFLADIVLTFFCTYTDNVTNMEVTEQKKIALRYIQSWLIFDVLSIIPFDYFIMSAGGGTQSNVNSLLRFAKFSKIYKIVRLTRLAKVFKLIKKNKTLFSRLTEKLRISMGFERLVIFFFFFGIFIHVASCLYILLAQM